ncbi:ABC transporter permease [Kribbella deserti]|uniref:Transport permease protein n=1 Tax=Kribbella deserti TaxID=1926257 RepID=A0ABV6QWK6_9ACTN
MSQTLALTRTESKLFLREWTSVFFVFALPLGLLAIFSVVSTGDGSDAEQNIPASFLPTMAIGIGLSMLGLATLPTVLATYREKGILRRLSTTPVRPVKVLTAQLIVQAAAAAMVVVLIVAVGSLAFGAALPESALKFVVAVVLSCVGLFALGLLVAALTPTAKGATVIGNILFFPSMFFAGVWTPGDLMPESVRWLRDVTPMGAGMSAMQDAWAGAWPDASHILALVVTSVICLAVAARYFRWE